MLISLIFVAALMENFLFQWDSVTLVESGM